MVFYYTNIPRLPLHRKNGQKQLGLKPKKPGISALELEKLQIYQDQEYVGLVKRLKRKRLRQATEDDEGINNHDKKSQYQRYEHQPTQLSQLSDQDLQILHQTRQLGSNLKRKAPNKKQVQVTKPVFMPQSDDFLSFHSDNKRLTSFEKLPGEILELVFTYSHNFELPLASKTLLYKLSSVQSFPDEWKKMISKNNTKFLEGRALHLKMLSHLSCPVQNYKLIKPEDPQTFEYFYKHNTVPLFKLHTSGKKYIPASHKYLKSKKIESIPSNKLRRVRRYAHLRAANVNILKRKFVTAELLQMSGIKYLIDFTSPYVANTSSLAGSDDFFSLSQILKASTQTTQDFVLESQSSTRSSTPIQFSQSSLSEYTIYPKQHLRLHPSEINPKIKLHNVIKKEKSTPNGNGDCVEVCKLDISQARKLPYCILPIPSYLFTTSSKTKNDFNFAYTGIESQLAKSIISKRKVDIIIYLLNFKSYSIPFIRAVSSLSIQTIKHMLNIDKLEKKRNSAVDTSDDNSSRASSVANDTNNQQTQTGQNLNQNQLNGNNRQTSEAAQNQNGPAGNETRQSADENEEEEEEEEEDPKELLELKAVHEQICTSLLVSVIARFDFEAIDRLADKKITIVSKKKSRRRRRRISLDNDDDQNQNDLAAVPHPASQNLSSGQFYVDLNHEAENDEFTEEDNADNDDEEDEDDEENNLEPLSITEHHLIIASQTALLLALQKLPARDTDDLAYIRKILSMSTTQAKSSDEVWEWLLSESSHNIAISNAEKDQDYKNQKGNRTIADKYHMLASLVFEAGGQPSLHAISSQTR